MTDDEFRFPDDSDDGADPADGDGGSAESSRRRAGVAPDSDSTAEFDATTPEEGAPRSGDGPGDDHGPDEESPLGGLARSVRDRRTRRNDADRDADPTTDLLDTDEDTDGEVEGASEELFESVDVEDVDSESVWASLEEDAETEQVTPGGGVAAGSDHAEAAVGEDGAGPVPFDAEVERVERDEPGAVRPDHVVPKRKFCQQCQYFSDPPAVACGHEGTDIVEVTDTDHFRVRGCPMVEESER
jgi:hypothetical protein